MSVRERKREGGMRWFCSLTIVMVDSFKKSLHVQKLIVHLGHTINSFNYLII